jgi:predicted porin
MNGGFDPFLTGTVGSVHTGGIAATIRANNAIYYRSPSMGGLSVHAAIAAGEGQLQAETANNFGNQAPTALLNRERPAGFNLRYAAGPLNVGIAYDRNTVDYKTTGVYGAYDFRVVKLMAQFEKGDSLAVSPACTAATCVAKEDIKNFSIGATAPVGPVLIRAGYVRTDSNLAGRDGSKFGFGGDYSLSKRTNLYATVGKLTGDRFRPGIISTSVNQRKAMFDLGVTHRF